MLAPERLAALATARGYTLWHYRTADALDDVLAPRYFDLVAPLLSPGDRIQLNGAGVAGDLTVLDVGTVRGEPYVRVGALPMLQT